VVVYSFLVAASPREEILIMNGQQNPTPERTVFSYDSKAQITVIPDRKLDPAKSTVALPHPETVPVTPPPCTFEHEREKGIFRLKWSDGEVEVFRDKPARYLVVEPDRKTGELKPVITRYYPTYLDLCREEREVR
jgi:hypothetical protein